MTPAWRPVYIAIGSNLNDPKDRVLEAFDRLKGVPSTHLVLRSRLYSSRPMGPKEQPDFVNAAAGLLTLLAARELLAELLNIERGMGRRRAEHWGPRVIDLDLLVMPGESIAEPGLTLPHPGVPERNFVLYPLADIAPTLTIPGHGSVYDLRNRVGCDGLSILG